RPTWFLPTPWHNTGGSLRFFSCAFTLSMSKKTGPRAGAASLEGTLKVAHWCDVNVRSTFEEYAVSICNSRATQGARREQSVRIAWGCCLAEDDIRGELEPNSRGAERRPDPPPVSIATS